METKNRVDYDNAFINIESLNNDPFILFEEWYNLAVEKEIFEPYSFVLSTSNLENKISNRVVLMRSFDQNGIKFYTNYDSKKGKDIEQNSNVAVCFYWYKLQRQIRIEGLAQKLTQNESTDYFYSRPKENQISTFISEQSKEINNINFFLNQFEEAKKEYENKQVPKPQNWGGYLIIPNYFEFWLGMKARLHQRIVFEKKLNIWKIKLLYP